MLSGNGHLQAIIVTQQPVSNQARDDRYTWQSLQLSLGPLGLPSSFSF
jgi:hypothetical protein